MAERLPDHASEEELAKETDERWWLAEIHRLQGAFLLRGSAPAADRAEACFKTALETAASQGARSLELRAAENLARLWAEHGEHRKAYDLLAPLYNGFTEGFDTPDLRDVKILLDALA